MTAKVLLPFLLILATESAWAQQKDTIAAAKTMTVVKDTFLLRPERLGYTDVQTPLTRQGENVKIISGSRFPIEAKDLPFSTYIITKEEIRQNGYETLVDALKMAPGIRVSQPGNGIEGETFLMRGLFGNTYTKILINDVPIKPVFVGGMPIGAQLPVKEAERIEVIYGAGAALYGADASAGVINIITKQSERPVYMQADLSVGQGLYSSVNVQFGAKLGRERNIFRLFAFGSNVLFERRNIFYDLKNNYNPTTYFLLGGDDTSFVKLANYAGWSQGPVLTNTPHMSRKFGMTLNFRGITLSVESMYRRDHSSLGLNPLAVTYRNPLTYTGEGIWRFNLNFFKNKLKHNRKTDFTFIRYRLDDRSSVLYVQNQLNRVLLAASDRAANETAPKDSIDIYRGIIFRSTLDRFLDRLRYMYGRSDEGRFEHVRNYRLLKIFSLTAGVNVKLGCGVPISTFVSRPVSEQDIDLTGFDGIPVYNKDVFPLQPIQQVTGEFNAFCQVFYNGEQLKLAGGVYFAALSDVLDASSSPRLAGLYKIGPNLNVRASWGRAFRAPTAYYRAVSYLVNSSQLESLQRDFDYLDPEETESLETGVRWQLNDVIRLDVNWFSNKTTNLVRYLPDVRDNYDSLLIVYLGYQNDSASEANIKGGQLNLRFSNFIAGNRIEAQYNFTWSKTKTKLEFTIPEQEVLPAYNGRIHQFRLITRPLNRTTLIFDGLWVNKSDSISIEGKTTDGFFTLDAVGRFSFNERLDIYLKIINLLDTHYAGIRATGTLDDLRYNPQSGFFLRLGMNYVLE